MQIRTRSRLITAVKPRPWTLTALALSVGILFPWADRGSVTRAGDLAGVPARAAIAGDELMRSGESPPDPQADALAAASTSAGWPATSAWKTAAPCPARRFESYGFSYGGKLYIMGGWADSKFNSTRRVDVYDPAKNTWKRLKDMQAPETHAGVAVDANAGVVYFVAGHRGKYPSTPTDGVWKYTISSDSWTMLPARLPYKMGANAAAYVDGRLYSFGGNYADRVTNTADTFRLDLSKTSAGFARLKSFPSARDHLAHAVIGGKIYAVGGEFGHDKKHDQQNLLHRFDPETNTWTRLADMPGSKSHDESSTFVLNGDIVSAGGQTDPQAPVSNVYRYDPPTNRWTYLARLPTARQGTTVQKVGSYFVFTIGGIATSQPQSTTWVAKAY